MRNPREQHSLVLALPGFESLAPSGPGIEQAGVSVERFENAELRVRLAGSVVGRDCFLVGSVAPPDSQLVHLSLAADTLSRNGARSVTAVLPYLAYARQDEVEPGASLAAAWVGAVLAASGVHRLVTIDIHSERACELIGIPVSSLSPARLFARALNGAVAADVTVVAPDKGALARSRAVARELGLQRRIVRLEKERGPGGIVHQRLIGRPTRAAIVVDDILDTGDTLVSCCRMLCNRGVEQIRIAVTHALLTGDRWRALRGLGVEAIHTTDSVPGAGARAPDLVRVHSVVPFLQTAIAGGTRTGRARAGGNPGRRP